jgi:hypothetical protein
MTPHAHFISIFWVQTHTDRPKVMLRERHVSGAAFSGVNGASEGVTICVFAEGSDTYNAGFHLFSAKPT